MGEGTDLRPIGEGAEYSYRTEDGGLTSFCHTDATNIVTADCGVQGPDGHWPALVSIDIESGTVLPHDARVFALGLIALANEADRRNAKQDAGVVT